MCPRSLPWTHTLWPTLSGTRWLCGELRTLTTDEPEPVKYYLCDLPKSMSLQRLVATARGGWRVEQDYQQMKEELGLDHFEGRSWTGWHHHVTMVMLAHLF